MCGFVGIVSKNIIDDKNLLAMRDTLTHRGPDSCGVYISPNHRVGLGFRRLSIIDLTEAGSQPMSTIDGDLTIVFNGEVYNYSSIKQELLSLGYSFNSQSDSEVVLYSYKQWGADCLQKFQGMFAFAIYDLQKNNLFIARDRLGIKPLYYFHDYNNFVFGSELKSIIQFTNFKKEICKDALNDYFAYGYVPNNKSIFKGVNKLEAGYKLIYSNGTISLNKYWELRYNPKHQTEDEIVSTIYDKLKSSVKLWSVSDVPVGIFLSGGLDSSAVCGLASIDSSDVQTFTIGFDYQKNNELQFAKEIAEKFHANHYEKIVDVIDAENLLDIIANIYDEPFVDSSSIPTYYLSKFTAQNVKVALAGDGGDELFFGYHRYDSFINLHQSKNSLKSKVKGLFSNLSFLPYGERLSYYDKYSLENDMQSYFRLVGFFDTDERNKILCNEYKNFDQNHLWLFDKFYDPKLPPTTSLRLLDINTYLVDDILTKVDRATMSVSLEARTPLLEHTLAEYIMSIEDEFIYKNNDKKYLLKKALSTLLPAQTIQRSKKGFGAPIRHWLKNDLNILIEKKLFNGSAVKDGILSVKGIKSMLNNYSENRWAKLWMLLMFELWYCKWMKD
ncbi:MAG: asparagine synthase (glutamine-hydrolyzing) [Chlorobiota bacterium]|nr:MAG: asparagine synthase (glutamine-hydrolyzing) [Chlorobiota bacterium]